MPDQNFLNNVFTEKKFSKEEVEIIIPNFKRVEFSKTEFLLEECKTANRYFFVESGFIRSYATDVEGNDISTNFYSIGDIVIDWPSFFLRTPTRENIQALTDCVCWQLDFETFQQLFHSIEAFRENGRTTLVGSYFELKRHSISMITDQAKDRYKRLIREKPLIVQHVSLKQIATYLGITDTSLSRIRKEITSE
ncbi:MAG: Crp/Fnr family transcriptional regulator [Bacteroidetes bacterium]|nr:Crp/Fnr family transcriptional regulator [Bacteroidota bacterium]